jgi:hypothetical protein
MRLFLSSIYLKPFIILLVSAHFFGCSPWKRVKQPIEDFIETKPERILVKKKDNTKLEVYYPIIENDSLLGIDHNSSFAKTFGIYLHDKIALSEIQNIYVKGSYHIGTFLGIIGLGLIIAFLVTWYAIGDWSWGPYY